MAKKLKTLPKFKNEDTEREFWSTHDSTDYIDWSQAKKLFPPILNRLLNRFLYVCLDIYWTGLNSWLMPKMCHISL